MGDLISSSWDGGAETAPPPPAAAGARWAAAEGGAASATGACATTTCSPPAFVWWPALVSRTTDQDPNKPRRTSIAPSSGASFRICTSWAMMSMFMGPKLHDLYEVRQPVRQQLRRAAVR